MKSYRGVKERAVEIATGLCEHSVKDDMAAPCDPCLIERVMVLLGERRILYNTLLDLCDAKRPQDMDWFGANRLLRDLIP